MPPLGEILEPAGSRDDDVGALQPLGLRADRRAAVRGLDAEPFGAPIRASSPQTCVASSRVGTRTSAGARRCRRRVRSTIGSPNASVFPEPVGALARTSRPARASGRTRVWMGNGSTMPRSASTCSTAALTPSARNEWDNFCSTPSDGASPRCCDSDRRRRNEKPSHGTTLLPSVVRTVAAGRSSRCRDTIGRLFAACPLFDHV